MNTEQKHTPEPFRITGPGDYRMRDGGKATVTGKFIGSGYDWVGVVGQYSNEWRSDGATWQSGRADNWDLIAPWPDYPSLQEELLEALEELLRTEKVLDDGDADLEEAREKARAVIAKAMGGA